MQLFESIRWIGLEDVEQPKQEKPGQRCRPPDRDERQGDEHANDLVDHHGTRIDPAKILLSGRACPNPAAKSPAMSATSTTGEWVHQTTA